jgi:hypothetical protein
MLRFNERGKEMKEMIQKQTETVPSISTVKRRDKKMKRELWNQGLMYLIVSLVVFLALPLASLLT